MKALHGEHAPETETCGITSFAYRQRRPFHPERFHRLIEDGGLDGVIRSKGFFWSAGTADRPGLAGDAPAAVDPDPGRPATQELAIIGVDLGEDALRARLEACLRDDEEMAAGPPAWQHCPDPFPAWRRVGPTPPPTPGKPSGAFQSGPRPLPTGTGSPGRNARYDRGAPGLAG
jgi:hypothetical protein